MKNIISAISLLCLMTLTFSSTVNAGALSELKSSSATGSQAVCQVAVPVTPTATSVPVAAQEDRVQREWLVMVFISGINNLYTAAYYNVNQMEYGLWQSQLPLNKVAIVTEFGALDSDGAGNLIISDTVKTLLIKPDSTVSFENSSIVSEAFFESKSQDMGNVNSLVRFVNRAVRKYPAKKTALIIWNHGAGIGGIASDDVSGSMMKLKDLRAGLAKITATTGKKFDVLATDACLMQMASIMYEFKDYAKVIVGSQQPIPGAGYPYDGIVRYMGANLNRLNAESFGSMLVEGYGQVYNGQPFTSLSAVHSNQVKMLATLMDNFADAVMADSAAFKAASSKQLLANTAHMDQMEESKDLTDYVNNIMASPDVSASVKTAGQALVSFIKSDLQIKMYASERDNYGVSVYLPDLIYDSATYNTLELSKASRWGIFVNRLLNERVNENM